MSRSSSAMENERVKSSRRKFLRSAVTIAGATLGYQWLKSTQFLVYAAEPDDKSLPWYGIVIDIEMLCTEDLPVEFRVLDFVVPEVGELRVEILNREKNKC